MKTIDAEVEMSGSSDAELVPVRVISVSAVLRGVGASGPSVPPSTTPTAKPEPEPDGI